MTQPRKSLGTKLFRVEDRVQSLLKNRESLNWLVPVMIGAPDMINFDFFNWNDRVALSRGVFFVDSNFPKACKLCDKKIAFYLAGLWEGDGHVVLPSFRLEGSVKNTPCMAITAGSKQLFLFKAFQQMFGG